MPGASAGPGRAPQEPLIGVNVAVSGAGRVDTIPRHESSPSPPPAIDMNLPTRFSKPRAVDTWDAEFRWRCGGVLRDVTIEDTWRRVTTCAAAAEGEHAAQWSRRFGEAFARWRLLPDERLLQALGTDRAVDPAMTPGAVVNVAAFVVAAASGATCFDRERFVDTAALAVRFLDDAAATAGATTPPRRLRIGLVGFADALRALDLRYDSAGARTQAAIVARALAQGCLRGSVELAEDRGPRVSREACAAIAAAARRRLLPEDLVQRVLRSGLCHDELTAIDAHPSLARLANGVADGVDPVVADGEPPPDAAVVQAMRAALQPWIDAPIAVAFASPEAASASAR